nr:pantoate--beta-alanine ligase [Acidobacteriota bacterium]
DYVFAPDKEEIYGENFSTLVTVENLTETLEGASRPGHFRGVATIVTILFNTIRPDFAFFGQKDAQQVAIIKRLTKDLGFDTEIVVGKIVREESGLAMSSRNALLSVEEREKAAVIYKALRAAKIAVKEGERNAAAVAAIVRSTIAGEPLAQVDYVAVVDNETLAPVEKITENAVLIAVAARFGNVRLIDNTVINKRS